MVLLSDVALRNVCNIIIKLHPDDSLGVLGMKDILISLHIIGVVISVFGEAVVKTFERNERPSELESLGFVLIVLDVVYVRSIKLLTDTHVWINDVYEELSITL